ncbi:hypothetical protein WOC76_16980 [Methylocystis sp. IM3]|jgi:hypothetical protein|uniref:hypothetical protein n=1 Tax=Methylocystis sp. IM3 TaxID=3136722 RepID=UPI000FB557E6|nr:MAG: hypothetical protein EKK29_06560 [Hyphomicrobiales bacterium]
MNKGFAGLAALALLAAPGVETAVAFDFPKLGMPEMLGGKKDAPQTPGATADCPVIVAEDGAQMLRTPPGVEAASVHHQVSIKDIARECVVNGDQIVIRVGVEGDAMLGPAGAPGAYGGTIRVALRRTKDDSIVSTKNYRVNASIPAGGARADFRLLADPLTVPANGKAQEEYEILVGFTGGAADAEEKPAARRKKGRR